jgi:hypothetical protein
MKCTTCRCGNVYFGDVCAHLPAYGKSRPEREGRPGVTADESLLQTLKHLRQLYDQQQITQAEYDELRVNALATF